MCVSYIQYTNWDDGIHLCCETCDYEETMGYAPSLEDLTKAWEVHVASAKENRKT